MKARELIQELEALVTQYGDLTVYYYSDGTGESGDVEVQQVRALTNDERVLKDEHTAVAFELVYWEKGD